MNNFLKIQCLAISLLYSAQAMAQRELMPDRTQESGNNFTTMTGNVSRAAESIALLIISLTAMIGFVVVALSLVQLYKASSDEREKPTGAIVGLFVGGAMAATGTIMFMMRNTIIG